MPDHTEHDLRQLSRMRLALNGYLSNEISIHDLVGTLSFLLGHLDDTGGDWKGVFLDKWMLLEIINADSREQQRKLTFEEHQHSLEVVADLKEILPC